MALIAAVSINVEALPKEKFVKGKKGVYYNFTVVVNDDTNDFGQNVSITDSQTKEEREAKAPKKYIGNGKVVWNNGVVNNAEKPEDKTPEVESSDAVDDLPF